MKCPKCESDATCEMPHEKAPPLLEMNKCEECGLVFPTIQYYKWDAALQREVLAFGASEKIELMNAKKSC